MRKLIAGGHLPEPAQASHLPLLPIPQPGQSQLHQQQSQFKSERVSSSPEASSPRSDRLAQLSPASGSPDVSADQHDFKHYSLLGNPVFDRDVLGGGLFSLSRGSVFRPVKSSVCSEVPQSN